MLLHEQTFSRSPTLSHGGPGRSPDRGHVGRPPEAAARRDTNELGEGARTDRRTPPRQRRRDEEAALVRRVRRDQLTAPPRPTGRRAARCGGSGRLLLPSESSGLDPRSRCSSRAGAGRRAFETLAPHASRIALGPGTLPLRVLTDGCVVRAAAHDDPPGGLERINAVFPNREVRMKPPFLASPTVRAGARMRRSRVAPLLVGVSVAGALSGLTASAARRGR
jgi:hypothetical protein